MKNNSLNNSKCTCNYCFDCDCKPKQRILNNRLYSNLNSNNNNIYYKKDGNISDNSCQTDSYSDKKNSSFDFLKIQKCFIILNLIILKLVISTSLLIFTLIISFIFKLRLIFLIPFVFARFVTNILLTPIKNNNNYFYLTMFISVMLLITFILISFLIMKNFLYFIYFYLYDEFFHKISNYKGIECEPGLELYFVKFQSPISKNNRLIQLEVSVKDGFLIKYCQEVEFFENYLNNYISLNKKSEYLEYECSKKAVNSTKIKKSYISNLDTYYFKAENLDHRCLNEYLECEPMIKKGTKKINLNNQLNFDLKHCYCSHKFYNCLKKSFSNLALKIGYYYFNYLNLKCFHYEFKHKCKFYLFGNCIVHGDLSCHIKLVKNPNF